MQFSLNICSVKYGNGIVNSIFGAHQTTSTKNECKKYTQTNILNQNCEKSGLSRIRFVFDFDFVVWLRIVLQNSQFMSFVIWFSTIFVYYISHKCRCLYVKIMQCQWYADITMPLPNWYWYRRMHSIDVWQTFFKW